MHTILITSTTQNSNTSQMKPFTVPAKVYVGAKKFAQGFTYMGLFPNHGGGPYLLKTKSLVAPFWRNRVLKIASYGI